MHLGIVITAQLDDLDDILQRRNNYICQVNTVACYFNKLTWRVRLKLYQSYCSNLSGCELWSLYNCAIERFCVVWRKGLRRIMGLPYAAHGHLLPLLSNSPPIFNEICRRFAKFILSSLCNGQRLFVQLQNIMAYLLTVSRLLVVMLC